MRRWVIEAQDGHTTWYARGFREVTVPSVVKLTSASATSTGGGRYTLPGHRRLEVEWVEDLRYALRFDSEVEVAATCLRLCAEAEDVLPDTDEEFKVREIDIPADLLAAECAYRGLKGAF